MAGKRVNTTRIEILQTALKMFLEYGYSSTSPKMICNELDISLGSLTYYFPTKEHMLSVFVEMLSDFQWKKVQEIVNDGETAITALCFELTAMAAMCEESEVARDFYLAAYTNTRSLEKIRKNDGERSKTIYKEYCSDWTEEQFALAENIVSGIEYAILRVTSDSPPLEMRIAGAMDNILGIYGVPEEKRKRKIEKALSLQYRTFGQQMLKDFKNYVTERIERHFDEIERKGLHYVKKNR
jgi:AcrR family transcriptional regulator